MPFRTILLTYAIQNSLQVWYVFSKIIKHYNNEMTIMSYPLLNKKLVLKRQVSEKPNPKKYLTILQLNHIFSCYADSRFCFGINQTKNFETYSVCVKWYGIKFSSRLWHPSVKHKQTNFVNRNQCYQQPVSITGLQSCTLTFIMLNIFGLVPSKGNFQNMHWLNNEQCRPWSDSTGHVNRICCCQLAKG
jgi:hypothetical protein